MVVTKANQEIRKLIKQSNIYAYLVASHLGMHENTFFRMLRKELDNEQKRSVIIAIQQVTHEQTELNK